MQNSGGEAEKYAVDVSPVGRGYLRAANVSACVRICVSVFVGVCLCADKIAHTLNGDVHRI